MLIPAGWRRTVATTTEKMAGGTVTAHLEARRLQHKGPSD
jgi:hypothetical protein